MKKTQSIFILLIGIVLIAPLSVFAATGFSIIPASGNYDTGQIFSVSIFVNPQGEDVYTTKVELKYPASLLTVESFSFNDAWLQLKQPGYDLIDNAGGTLIKTAGYLGGLSSQAKLGTVVFRAKSAGSATISIGSNSMVLDANNDDVFNNVLAQSVLTLSTPQPVVAPSPKPVLITEEVEEPAVTEEVTIAETEMPSEMNPAMLATLSVLNVVKPMAWLVIALIALASFFLLPEQHKSRKINFARIKKNILSKFGK